MNSVNCFGHQKLKVYNKSLQFLAVSDELLASILCKIAANGHLCRAAESISRNIAYASSSWSPKERIVSLGNANGSALECAACLDVFVAKQLLKKRDIMAGKSLLREIVNMLIAMKKIAADRLKENDSVGYVADRKIYFSHEKLDVYITALQFIGWIEGISEIFTDTSSISLYTSLDKVSTGIVLNIAEGSGRFSNRDRRYFFVVARSSAFECVAILDVLKDEEVIKQIEFETFYTNIEEISKILFTMIKNLSAKS